ncbi:MAG: DUF503 domain-containing protein [Candidatus Aminicenantes bacterium]|nr:DUF503 domain-containing protein [Candidatus Aminicenantes bacterium]
MTIGTLEIDLFGDQFHSLKDKRRLVSSLKERLKNQFNVAVAESDHQDLWQRAQLTVVSLAPGRPDLESTFRQVEDFVCRHYALRITRLRIRYY